MCATETIRRLKMTLRCHCLQTEKRLENSTGIKVAKWHITSQFSRLGNKDANPSNLIVIS